MEGRAGRLPAAAGIVARGVLAITAGDQTLQRALLFLQPLAGHTRLVSSPRLGYGAVGEPCRKSFAPEPEARSQWAARRRRAPATHCVISVILVTKWFAKKEVGCGACPRPSLNGHG